ncbi:hypothetical protein lerEdw1_006443 [Lerista edwardsae]|nr:hypothetical protein lerEdw1_006443 [Lerista edwardsae]
MSFVVRPCAPRDLKDVMRLIREIAVIYKVPLETIQPTVEELKKIGFEQPPRYECFVAEVPPEQKSKEGHTLIGYVLSVPTFNTWRGKNLYMDNLYVMPEFRGRGIGNLLLKTATEAALRQGCTQLRMHVSREKPANLDFLELRGGEDLTLKEGWHLLRFLKGSLQEMAARSTF